MCVSRCVSTPGTLTSTCLSISPHSDLWKNPYDSIHPGQSFDPETLRVATKKEVEQELRVQVGVLAQSFAAGPSSHQGLQLLPALSSLLMSPVCPFSTTFSRHCLPYIVHPGPSRSPLSSASPASLFLPGGDVAWR